MPRRALFVCLVLVTALGALDQTIVATALPAVVADLGAPCRDGRMSAQLAASATSTGEAFQFWILGTVAVIGA
ncbi:hypothetical protein ABZY90_37955, partial [Streptomyces sp. NPDC006422]